MNIDQIFQNILTSFEYSFEKPWFFTEFSFLLCLVFFLFGYAFMFKFPKGKSIYLILFSLFFYYKSSGPFLILFIAVIVCDFFLAQQLAKQEGRKRRWLLWFSIAYSLSFLLYFKYTNFIIDNLNFLLKTQFTHNNLFLPIGISFYTFQSLSYLIDVSRKEIAPSTKILDYSFYMTFFPHLVAGPIVRAKDFLPQISNPLKIDSSVVKEALFKITIGLTKKLFLADYFAKYVDLVHDSPTGFSGFEHFISMYSYAFQIYFDFSGYSDIAIGIALILGYRLKENFQNPYIAKNITEFWRKWHISLSLWLRDYIYIPLGGNRNGIFRMYFYIFLTMLIGGIWHGADWKFIFWGCAHGFLLVIHKLLSNYLKWENKAIKIFGIIFTFHLVAFLWIFFRASSIDVAYSVISKIFCANNLNEFTAFFEARPEIIFLLTACSFIVFLSQKFKQKVINRVLSLPLFIWPFLILIILQIILQFREDIIQPFIYFQF